MDTHIKQYSNISIPYDKFIKKTLLYANPTSMPKEVMAQIDCPYVKLKEDRLFIKPFSNGNFRLRIYFDKSCSPKTQVIMKIKDEKQVEQLHFYFRLYE